MQKLMRWLMRLLLVAAVLAGAWLLVIRLHWLPRLSEEQQTALALMESRPDTGETGDNLLVTLALIFHEVPDAEFSRWQQHGPEGLASALRVAGHQLRVEKEDLPACGNRAMGCLEFAQSNPSAARQRMKTAMPLIQRLPYLYRAQHSSIDYGTGDASLDDDIPAYEWSGQAARLLSAVKFVEGDEQGAVDTVCQDAAFWRRIQPRNDTLIGKMVAARYLIQDGELLNDMLAQAAPSTTVPPPCMQSFRPFMTAERDLCRAMRGEQRFLRHMLSVEDREQPWYSPPLDTPHSRAMNASSHSWICSAEQVAKARARKARPTSAHECSTQEWLFNPRGCELINIAAPDVTTYILRMDDYSANLGAIHTALLINQRDETVMLEQAFADRPMVEKRERQQLEIDDHGNVQLLLPADVFQPGYRFTPLNLRGDAPLAAD